MKYKDFKKMSADEMKEVKGGQGQLDGILVDCGYGPFCISGLDDPNNCCVEPAILGNCPPNNDFC